MNINGYENKHTVDQRIRRQYFGSEDGPEDDTSDQKTYKKNF